MIVTVKNEVNEPEVRLRAPRNKGSRGVLRSAQEDETKYFFQAGNSGIYQRFPFRLQKDISTRQLAAEKPIFSGRKFGLQLTITHRAPNF